MQKRINRIISYTCFFALILIIESCKKEISIEKYSNIKISEKFFTHESSTNKIVLRVIDEIKRRNNKSEFVSKFAICNGYPIWNKAIISSSSNQFSKESSTNNLENTQNDTFAYFPLVIENSDKINGFILAKINNGIDLIYSLSKDYKAFSFNNDGSNLNDASKFVLTNLLLNKEVFGVSEYKITDYRLFTGDPEHDKVSKLSIQGQLNAGDCAIISWSTQHCETPYTTQCRNGCDNCGYPICYPENSSIEICSAPNGVNWPSGGIDIGISGGVSTDGTGGGEASGGDGGIGGAEIPHYYPCQSNPIPKSMNQIPPCPEPGPGNGWTPLLAINNKPCIIAHNNAKKLDTIYINSNSDSMLNLIPDLANERKEYGFNIYQKISINSQNPTDTTFNEYKTTSIYSGTDSSINFSYNLSRLSVLVSFFHTHPASSYPSQSAFDVYSLIESRIDEPYHFGDFVTGADGSQYAITISDPSLAFTFLGTKNQFLDGRKWNITSDIGIAYEKAFEYYSDEIYSNNPDKIDLSYEMSMAAVLDQFNSGITIYKKNAVGKFKPIVVKTTTDPRKPNKIIYIQECL